MEIRTHETPDIASEAAYSACGKYRYWLTRRWASHGGLVNFVMLNPSKADEFRNDPTVERCERRARQLGFGAFSVTNIFAWRDTDPKAMRAASDPVGPANDDAIIERATWAQDVIAAWGTHGAHLDRGAQVADLLRSVDRPLFHLGLSKAGHPKHPLYLPYTQHPETWV